MTDKKIAFLVATEGIEKAELVEPWQAVMNAGHSPVLICPEDGEVQLFEHLDKANTQAVDVTVSRARVDDYDALVLPGGVANPDRLRTDEAAVSFVREFIATGKPVAAICHAPWTLIEADAVRGVAVEYLFNYQGLGLLTLEAARQKDLPLLVAGVLVIGIVYLVVTLVADVVYALLNPRIRFGTTE